MASDGVVINAGAGGATIASDDVGGFQYQRVKVVWGADGSVNDTSAAAPMPINVTTLPILTKGTQGSTGLSVQDLKDAGRVRFSLGTVIAGVTAVNAEAVLTLTPSRDGVDGAPATTHAVTAGKRLRITSITVGFISTAAAVISARFVLRVNPSGAAIVTSPIVLTIPLSSAPAIAQQGNEITIPIPDGLEFSGNDQITISHVANVITGTVWVSAVGFEY